MESKIVFPHEINLGNIVLPNINSFMVENITDKELTITVNGDCGCINIPVQTIVIPALNSSSISFFIGIKRVDTKEIHLNEALTNKHLGSIKVSWQ